ncbi:23S rRNA (pseudouridine(1915)-N(3))-methyltransferase RlmH [Porticoccaceae bacterium LTM1]|nr:23S rRNA (pseudouridine(1915)-N(3))-methyltransferase RlmH [Porticoccaceae bacterium LTM1]
MKLKIIAVGTKMPAWVEAGFTEYSRRMPPELKIELIELPLGQRGKGADIKRAMAKEGEAMMKAIAPSDKVIALDVLGKSWSTEKLASQLADWQFEGCDFCFLIGGPDGLAPECLARADAKWSLSALTMPHPLVRIMLAEQLYRAWTINVGHPYHKA